MAAPKKAVAAVPKAKPAPTKKSSSAKAAPSHPPYATMISASIKKIGDRTGSSQQAIAKCITEEYKIDVNKVALSKSLKSGVDAGTLAKVKASYKVIGKEKSPPKKKPVAKKATANGKEKKPKQLKPKKTATTKKTTSKPKTTKKAAKATSA